MNDFVRVVLEVGPKGKRVVAVAPDWPGLSRGAKTAEAAVERLLAYVPRYAPVAELAGLGAAFPAAPSADVIGDYRGSGSTDFWGISFAFSDFDRQAVSNEDLERELALMRAGWAFLDRVAARVPAELAKGPRGGGRDRDDVVRHVVGSEQHWARKLGLNPVVGDVPTGAALDEHRDDYCREIRRLHAEGKPARTWPLRYLIRHTAFHALDHAWEMEDRDPGGSRP